MSLFPDPSGTEMRIIISSDRLIRDIQNDFNKEFPFLKIEFFRLGYHSRQITSRSPSLPSQLTIGTAYTKKKEAKIFVTSSTTMKQLEKDCVEQFGISVQLYRNSGNMWLEATMTAGWTMKQQNDHGNEISVLIDKKS